MSNHFEENDRNLNIDPTPDSSSPDGTPPQGPPEGPSADDAPADAAPAGYSNRHMVAVGAGAGVVGAGAATLVCRYTAASTGEELTKRRAAAAAKTFLALDGRRYKLGELFYLGKLDAGHPVAGALRTQLEGRFVETKWQRACHPLTNSVNSIIAAGEAYAALVRAADEASAAHAAAHAALLAESGEDLAIAKERAALMAVAKLVLGDERKSVLSRIQTASSDVILGTVAVVATALDSPDMFRLLVAYQDAAVRCAAAQTAVDLTPVLSALAHQGANATATATAQATAQPQPTSPPKS